jgi:hypothetical protein
MARVRRDEVSLDADRVCRPRWVRYAVAVPEHVVAYRVVAERGLTVWVSTSSLELVVDKEYVRSSRCPWIEWSPWACAAVERECAALGRPVTFAKWWDAVTTHKWVTEGSDGRLVSYRRARGSHGHRAFGGYGGDYGTAGHSGGFGTSF